ncbi:SusC/RagA family TonB-linked outer membrane protein [Tunicatimonas pelagia]|uniref:SusC/RagA family TonB-linked outer membrane protein n=1 Tax=Tunicatimonas pelagia TaxID=931531 RepID=UPI0026652165|nr:TonB-dependent receptor [Tunicatimonas pelagia]WKN44197.1 TonB-dependent receptor [Tunicatimonas pelagia]
MRNLLLLLISGSISFGVFAQDITVSGRVTDLSSDEPLPGVNILAKGTATGTITDADGNYSLSLPNSVQTLVFSSIGYEKIEEAINGRSTINIDLSPDIQALQEIVVVGYGTQQKKDLTGAIVRADIESLAEQPNTNILQSLQGNVPGLNVGVETQAGETPSFSIRGQNSLSGSGEPLIVVDGIIYRGNLRDINTNDVASIDVLKDASSTAVYGSQAANGVILVTTKSGADNSGKPIFNYSGSFGLRTPGHVPDYYDTEGYIGLFEKFYWRQSRLEPDFLTPNPDFNPADAGNMEPEMVEALNSGNGVDWWDLITQTGSVQNHTLSISGGSERSRYYISGAYTDQKDVVINDEYQRITGRVNFENSLTDWLTIGTNSFVAANDLSGSEPSVGNGYDMPPLAIPYDENGDPVLFPTGLLRTSPLIALQEDNLDKVLSLSGILYATVEVPWVEGLSYRVNYSNNYRVTRQFNFDPSAQNFAGEARKLNRSNYDWTLDHILTYKHQFGDIHNLDVTLLYGRESRRSESNEATSIGFVNRALGYNSLEAGTLQQTFSDAWEEDMIYSMARVNYSLMDRYTLTGTVRRDGFSGFGENNKTGIFPSVGVGWAISEENFASGLPWLSFLKLRATYGVSGNRTLGRYATLSRIATQPAYVFGDGGGTEIGQNITTLANADLGWETTTGLNLGLDFGIVKDRISGNIEYYNTRTNDLLYQINIPDITGFSSVFTNLGEIANHGIEFTINTVNVKTSNFQWNSSFNYSRNRNEIVSLLGRDDDGDGQEDDIVASGLFIGEPIGAIYEFESDGIYQFGNDIPDGYSPGQYRIKNQNGDNAIDPINDRRILGYREPSYRFSFNNEFRYQNWTLKAYIYSIQGGNDFYYGNNTPYIDYIGRDNIITYYNIPKVWDFWTPDNPNAEYPALLNQPPINFRTYRQRSFIRLQNVSLGYNFNSAKLEEMGIRNLNVFINGNNLLTFTDWKGWDPEPERDLNEGGRTVRSPYGITRGGRPLVRSYTLGINFSF